MMRHMKRRRKVDNNVDGTTGIPKPIMYKGYQHQFGERKAKLLAYMRATVHRNVDQWIVWAGEHSQAIVEGEVDAYFGDGLEDVRPPLRSMPSPCPAPRNTRHSWSTTAPGATGRNDLGYDGEVRAEVSWYDTSES